ncbi:hypothetical protein LSUE1_G009777 [Lachnellula suecica]|uniref:Amidoligase enzyme n=1 Tax=Lachnellula suecica TaxID=602035 RepID=A0A8T9C1E9_9HELO|nr:hypothetical protein LSUE1_G009777 [Lachnellula suecica]
MDAYKGLTFGVEFEVAWAYFDQDKVDNPDPSETRKTTFELIEQDYWGSNKIDEPVLPLEFVSPAFYFTPDALKAVEDVLGLMTSTYVMNVNKSCGLHVHIGQARNGFKFDTLRKLTSFLFAFTPQLNTLHPTARQDISGDTPGQRGYSYAGSFRENSRMETRRRPTHKSRPTPLQVIARLLSAENTVDLLHLIQRDTGERYMSYNFSMLQEMAAGGDDDGLKPTIEFRQHEGSLDVASVIAWIQTVAGIVDFCMTSSTATSMKLLNVVIEHETWEKLGDGLDDEREAKLGPILADRDFTAIHLLEALKLWGPALHYTKKGLFRHEMKKSTKEKTEMWQYEKTPPADPAELAQTVLMRETWDALQAASKALSLTDTSPHHWTWDPANPLWPKHESIMDEGVDTDLSSPEGSVPDESSHDSDDYDDSSSGDSNVSDHSNSTGRDSNTSDVKSDRSGTDSDDEDEGDIPPGGGQGGITSDPPAKTPSPAPSNATSSIIAPSDISNSSSDEASISSSRLQSFSDLATAEIAAINVEIDDLVAHPALEAPAASTDNSGDDTLAWLAAQNPNANTGLSEVEHRQRLWSLRETAAHLLEMINDEDLGELGNDARWRARVAARMFVGPQDIEGVADPFKGGERGTKGASSSEVNPGTSEAHQSDAESDA